MVIIRASIRLLTRLSIKANAVKTHSKTIIFRSLATYKKIDINTFREPKLDQRRSFSYLASTIIKSPLPSMEIPESLLTDMIWSNYNKWPEATAMVCGITGRELTYNQLRLLCRRLATSLLKEGHKPGKVIAVIMPNMPEFVVVSLGILEAGLIATTINPLYTSGEIAYHLKDSQAVAIFTIPEILETIQGAKAMLELENKEYKLRIICTNSVLGLEPELPSGVDRYSHMVADNVDDSVLATLQKHDISINDTAVIPYSSGTTGRPKGVCLSHRNIVSSLLSSQHLLNFQLQSDGDQQEVFLFILPGFHVYGFSTHLVFGLYYGVKLVTLPLFEANSFLKALTNYKVSVILMVPPLIQFLGSSPEVTKDHLKSVNIVCCGAASLPESDLHKLFEKLPPTTIYRQGKCNVIETGKRGHVVQNIFFQCKPNGHIANIEFIKVVKPEFPIKESSNVSINTIGYGLTETSSAVCGMLEDKDKINSVGVLIANSLLKVVDLKTSRALGPNEKGEICLKGPQIMKGYLNNEIANAEVFDSEGWFHTGDVGYYDNDQYIYITDRIKELIKVKGFQVAPAELESLLKYHPEVADAAVIGVPDDRKGETPIAFVQLKNGATVTKDKLKAFLAPKVTDYKKIDKFIFVQSIPKNATGKILRKKLKENYLKEIN